MSNEGQKVQQSTDAELLAVVEEIAARNYLVPVTHLCDRFRANLSDAEKWREVVRITQEVDAEVRAKRGNDLAPIADEDIFPIVCAIMQDAARPKPQFGGFRTQKMASRTEPPCRPALFVEAERELFDENGVGSLAELTDEQLQQAIDKTESKISSYAGGDRAPSPPAKLLARSSILGKEKLRRKGIGT